MQKSAIEFYCGSKLKIEKSKFLRLESILTRHVYNGMISDFKILVLVPPPNGFSENAKKIRRLFFDWGIFPDGWIVLVWSPQFAYDDQHILSAAKNSRCASGTYLLTFLLYICYYICIGIIFDISNDWLCDSKYFIDSERLCDSKYFIYVAQRYLLNSNLNSRP